LAWMLAPCFFTRMAYLAVHWRVLSQEQTACTGLSPDTDSLRKPATGGSPLE